MASSDPHKNEAMLVQGLDVRRSPESDGESLTPALSPAGADELVRDRFLNFEAESYRLLHPFLQDVEGLRVGVTTTQCRNRGHVVAVRISLDDNVKFSPHV